MITKDEIQELLHSTETYRVERTTSTDERSKSRGQARLDYALQGRIRHVCFLLNLPNILVFR